MILTSIYALIFITFTFIGDPADEIVGFEAVKAPYSFHSRTECEEAAFAIAEQAQASRFSAVCMEVLPSNTK